MSDDTFQEIGFEYGLPVGFLASWSGMNDDGSPNPAVQGVAGAPPNGHGQNFFIIPTGKRVKKIYGTSVIKTPGVELLFRIMSGMGDDADSIVQEHHITPRLSNAGESKIELNLTDLPVNDHLTGNGYRGVWVEFQAINSSGAVLAPGAAFEFQLNFEMA